MKAGFAAAALALPLVFAGCAWIEEDAQRRQELQQMGQTMIMHDLRQKGIQIEKIDLPKEILTLEKGHYEMTIPTSKGPRECIGSVISTTHGYKNLILDCN